MRWSMVLTALVLILATTLCAGAGEAMSKRPQEGANASITDRTGETWDLSQAVTKGFEPQKFQHGIGRHAFTPLDQSRLTDRPEEVPHNLRVIGLAIQGQAVAVSVPLLSRHEIANLVVGGRPVAVAY
ncbi:MAG: hypothetical protein ACOCVU_04470 [Desulfohalobiaceae bacterium]